jgi:hypothetical protein
MKMINAARNTCYYGSRHNLKSRHILIYGRETCTVIVLVKLKVKVKLLLSMTKHYVMKMYRGVGV